MRNVFTFVMICAIVPLTGCVKYNTVLPSQKSLPVTFLSFDQYAFLSSNCDAQAILKAFAEIDHSDLPSIPLKSIRFCTTDLIVLEMESMFMPGAQDFRIIRPKERIFYRLELISGGRQCTQDDGCDTLTDEECDTVQGCVHDRHVILEDASEQVIQEGVIDSRDTLSVTDQDLIKIAIHGNVYVHFGEKPFVISNGRFEEILP